MNFNDLMARTTAKAGTIPTVGAGAAVYTRSLPWDLDKTFERVRKTVHNPNVNPARDDPIPFADFTAEQMEQLIETSLNPLCNVAIPGKTYDAHTNNCLVRALQLIG